MTNGIPSKRDVMMMGIAHAIDERLKQVPKEPVGIQLSPEAAKDLSRLIKGYYQLEARLHEKH